jgi:NAD(P)-dependent dehydrogenase (short-subunit alcohol dehydrogenase family)
MSADTPVVVVLGAGGAAGRAVAEAVRDSGRRVAAVDLREPSVEGCAAYAVDATDPAAVADLAARVRADLGRVDGLVHLIGGWRGGKGFASNTDDDWAFLSSLLIDTLRHTTRAFHDDLVASPAGRAVIVSATAAANPTAGGANYATAKAASETWMRALADSFARVQKDDGLRAAATVLVVKALVHDAMRADQPDATFPGYTDVADLAAAVLRVLDAPASDVNGERIDLTVGG